MTDENTLPEGWEQTSYNTGWGETHYWTVNGDYGFSVQDKKEAIRIARALSAPTIEDAKAAISKEISDERFSQYDEDFDKGLLRGLKQALNALDNLAPTPAPDLTQNTTVWGLLPKETQDALRALPEGAVQYWNGYDWIIISGSPEWYNPTVYRQDPDWSPAPLTKPAVPWDVLADWVQWVARDEDGRLFAYKSKPETGLECWMVADRKCERLNSTFKIDPGTCDWQDSLVHRAKGDE